VAKRAGERVEIGPLVLLDTPWSEQAQDKSAELPASFPLPEKQEGR
jgi:hypothetical protein